ncbi:hypothetical protein SAMN05660199_03970 [Klenkia soli]|uniref:Uncharacterized protein n=1 Tax=Klenkia soli TaxID=1052260 RepID=A0A1H0SYC9_9ACTN|nr:hypothetical protein [Klenkia soli]SDP46882.1 hypothetical protein SAMN05660199_03970 [Klenkia soli]
MSIIDHDGTESRHPAEGDDRLQLGRPVWAAVTEVFDDLNGASIRHTWTAEVLALGSTGSGDDQYRMSVCLSQIDDLKVKDTEGVVYERGRPAVFLNDLDTTFDSPEQARAYAAAIVECCDRWEGTSDT